MWCQNAASDADAIRCTGDWKWYQYCCIWCWDHQMHWRNCFDVSTLLHSISSRSDDRQLIFELLHSIAIKLNALTMLFDVRKTASDFERLNALTKLSVIKTAAFDAEIIECTDEIVWLSDCCIRSWNDQMYAGDCLLRKFVDQTFFAMKRRKLHSMLKSSNALTILSVFLLTIEL